MKRANIIVVDFAKKLKIPIALTISDGVDFSQIDLEERDIEDGVAAILSNAEVLQVALTSDPHFIMGFGCALLHMLREELSEPYVIIVSLDGEVSSREFALEEDFLLDIKRMNEELDVEFSHHFAVPSPTVH